MGIPETEPDFTDGMSRDDLAHGLHMAKAEIDRLMKLDKDTVKVLRAAQDDGVQRDLLFGLLQRDDAGMQWVLRDEEAHNLPAGTRLMKALDAYKKERVSR